MVFVFLKEIERVGFRLNVIIYNILVYGCIINNIIIEVKEIVKEME